MAERRILITDDEALFRTSAAESLRSRFRGVEVLEAEDGAAALAVIARLPVDVLITDLQMPNLGGIEVVARISSHRMPIQIIVVSAHITDQTRVTLDELGALVWVDKPIDLEFLHRAVERMLAVPRAHVSGVTLTGFVQLLEMERQTCALRVSSCDGVGTLVFEAGRLRDAWTGELAGDAAALAILRLRECTLDVIGALRTETPRVTLPLSFLLLESARRADEESPVAGQWELMSLTPPPLAGSTPAPEPSLAAPKVPNVSNAHSLEPLLTDAMKIDGALGLAIAEVETGENLGSAGAPGFDLAAAAAGNAAVLRAKQTILDRLAIGGQVEDILVTIGGHLHLIHPFQRANDPRPLFVYLVLDRARGNLGLARRELGKIVAELARDPQKEKAAAP